jgi:hypothetical protein
MFPDPWSGHPGSPDDNKPAEMASPLTSLHRPRFWLGLAGALVPGSAIRFRGSTSSRSAAFSAAIHELAQRRVLRGLLLYPGVPLAQQLPRPRARSAKPAIAAAGNAGQPRHGRTLPRLRLAANRQASKRLDWTRKQR